LDQILLNKEQEFVKHENQQQLVLIQENVLLQHVKQMQQLFYKISAEEERSQERERQRTDINDLLTF
jgi:hypothetical protein